MVRKILFIAVAFFVIIIGQRAQSTAVSDPEGSQPSTAADTAKAAATKAGTERWRIEKIGFYAQCQYHDTAMEQDTRGDIGFTTPRVRPFIRILYDNWRRIGLRTTAEAQIGGTSGTFLMQLYNDFLFSAGFADSLVVRVGQFTNYLMYMSAPPDKKRFVEYSLNEFYVAPQYPQGVMVAYYRGIAGINAAAVNGAGMNRSDDNTSLDAIFGMHLQPRTWLQFRAGYQYGRQPDAWRRSGFIGAHAKRGKVTVLGTLAIHEAYDIESRGWDAAVLYDATNAITIVARATQHTQLPSVTLEKGLTATRCIEGTLGIDATSGPLALKLNSVIVEEKIGFAAELQVSAF